ncbi:hypothetical protein DUNSADRAFT_11219 [Dunaliella salina]|uniref:Uncharacterized protein n=1 Tax=Dunaliella salina TaxID=3046 RepID=A0ABQ7GDV2_DUNSA|nr:hypothetical protein DUNSADRAFT_11219 [Dunaliella salina]|eukprot:KAF5832784.1 hypothetical protein DUNSADRAFT_11219 [Dunaliella salina]
MNMLLGKQTNRPVFSHRLQHRVRQLSVTCRAEVRARWCLDCKFGRKAEGTALLQEWVRDVGFPAGLSTSNTRLSSGAIGAPESRLELEVTFPSVSEWERFLGSVSAKGHKAWSQRIQSMVVDGSPAWHVYRSVPVELDEEVHQPEVAAVASPAKHVRVQPTAQPKLQQQRQQQQQQQQQQAASLSSQAPVSEDELQFDQLLQQELGSLREVRQQQSQDLESLRQPQLLGGGASGDLEEALKQQGVLGAPQDGDVDVVLDWKGDPMIIKPGDRMPKWL